MAAAKKETAAATNVKGCGGGGRHKGETEERTCTGVIKGKHEGGGGTGKR